MSLAECGARCGARPHCLGYNYQRAARSCALLTQPARFVPQPGHVAARKCTSCQLREWTKVIKFMIIFIYLNIIHKLISPSIDMHYTTFYFLYFQVIGPTAETINDISLEACSRICNSKSACSYFNYFYSKILSDSWAKCILIYSKRGTDISFANGDFVIR